MKTAIVYISYHHNNTEKVAKAMASILPADLKKVGEFDSKELDNYDLIGFGSGIYYHKHHKKLLELASALPSSNKKVFTFSTCNIVAPESVLHFHKALTEILKARGFELVDTFSCLGYDTVGWAKIFGGISKGHPNAEDLKKAETFALELKTRFSL
jgi:flavodoxin